MQTNDSLLSVLTWKVRAYQSEHPLLAGMQKQNKAEDIGRKSTDMCPTG